MRPSVAGLLGNFPESFTCIFITWGGVGLCLPKPPTLGILVGRRVSPPLEAKGSFWYPVLMVLVQLLVLSLAEQGIGPQIRVKPQVHRAVWDNLDTPPLLPPCSLLAGPRPVALGAGAKAPAVQMLCKCEDVSSGPRT